MEVRKIKFKKGVIYIPEGFLVAEYYPKFAIVVKYDLPEVETINIPSVWIPRVGGPPASTTIYDSTLGENGLDDGFSEACFMPEDDEVEMEYCEVCEQFVGMSHGDTDVEPTPNYCDVCEKWMPSSHNHVGETIKEKDTSEWANSIGRICDVCGHMDAIFPLSNGHSYSSELDFCTQCEAPWGHEQDNDRWASDYVERTEEPSIGALQCKMCGLFSTDFDGTQDCLEQDFHEWVVATAPDEDYLLEGLDRFARDPEVVGLILQFVEEAHCTVCEGIPATHNEYTHPFQSGE